MPIDFAPPQVGNLQGFNVTPPPNPDPLATLAQMSQLRTQGLQQQEAQLGLQQKSMDIQSERGFLKAYLEANGDPEKALQLAPGYGVLPTYMFNVKKTLLDMQTAEANKDKITLENSLTHNDMLNSVYQDAFNEKNQDKQAQLAADAGAEALRRGLVTPQTMFNYQGPDSLKHYESGLNTTKWITTQAQAQKDRAEAEAQQADVLLKREQTKRANLVNQLIEQGQKAPASGQHPIDAVFPPSLDAGINANYKAAYDAAARDVEPETGRRPTQMAILQAAANHAATLQLAGNPKTIAAAGAKSAAEQAAQAEQILPGLGAALGGGPAPGAAAPGAAPAVSTPAAPGAPAGAGMTAAPNEPIIPIKPPAQPGDLAAAKAAGATLLHGEDWIRANRLPPAIADLIRGTVDGRITIASGSRGNPLAAQRLREAALAYDPAWNEQRAEFRGAYTGAGPEATNIDNLNTAAVHAEQFLQAADAMKGGYFTPKNAVFNWFRRIFGDATPTNFDGIKAVWAGEMASALKGSATDPEIAAVEKSIKDTNSWEAFKGIVNTNLGALGAKLNTKYQHAQGIGINDWNPINPAAREVFRQHGMDPTAPPNRPASYKVGDSVMYQGKRHKITAIDPKTGKLTIDPNVAQ